MVHPQSLNECAQMLICDVVFCIWFFFFIVSFFGFIFRSAFGIIHHDLSSPSLLERLCHSKTIVFGA